MNRIRSAFLVGLMVGLATEPSLSLTQRYDETARLRSINSACGTEYADFGIDIESRKLN